MEYDVLKIDPMNEIISNLWLGSADAAFDTEIAKDITRIVNVTIELGISVCFSHKDYVTPEEFLRIPVEDDEFTNIKRFFDDTNEFIDKALKNGQKCLVHCFAGVSRSPTIVAAYLLHSGKVNTVDQALDFIKQRRECIRPNECFIDQLRSWWGE